MQLARGLSFVFRRAVPRSFGRVHIYNKGRSGHGEIEPDEKINAALTDAEIGTELIYCSSDPASLDGVYAPALNCLVVDGTPPHTLEPKYPGAAQEIIDLGKFWDKDILRSRRDEIISLSDENAAYHRRCRRFLEASALLREDILRLTLACADTAK